MIPIIGKILSGDKDKASTHLGLAQKQLDILLRQMKLSTPKPLETAERKLLLSDGTLITVGARYNTRTMRIYVPVGGEKEIEKDRGEECICNCNFTVGQIIEKQENTIDEASLYKVKVCARKEYYKTYENILASDYTDYADGQVVILIPYNLAEYSCCISTSASVTGCKPSESELEIANESWRSTLRIIPWCGVRVPKWLFDVKEN